MEFVDNLLRGQCGHIVPSKRTFSSQGTICPHCSFNEVYIKHYFLFLLDFKLHLNIFHVRHLHYFVKFTL